MKKIILLFTLVFGFNLVSAQSDVITKQIGEVLKGTIVKVDENTIVFTYEGQDKEYTIAKNAVEKIVYGKTGKTVKTSNKLVVAGEADWTKVIIVENLDYTAGLEKGNEIGTIEELMAYQTGSAGDKTANKALKIKAAKLGYPFILVTTDGASNRKAIVYKY
ncbi:hypothetical protein [Flavobacterium sp.]|uniref:hypothetical protein n=1 Tax=Flavobacterium sp. TaxID=239 RepID=UPI002FDA46B6